MKLEANLHPKSRLNAYVRALLLYQCPDGYLQFIHTSVSNLSENLSMKSKQVKECSEIVRDKERNRE